MDDVEEYLIAFKKAGVKFLVDLHEIHHAKISATAEVVDGIEQLFSLLAEHMKAQIRKADGKNAVQIIDSVLIQSPFKCFGSTHLLRKHLETHCDLVEPIEVLLGKTYKGDLGSNAVVSKDVYAQVVPLKRSLEQILSNKEMYDLIFKETKISNDTHSCFESVKDGLVYKNNEICQKHENALLLQLYEDDIEVVNPLGANVKKHKLLNIYFTIMNFPEFARSNLKAFSLVSVAKSKHVQEFGRKACLTDFFDVVRQLESDNGLAVNVHGKELVLHGTLICVAGDNLAMNQLGGFKGGFSFAKRPCRHCMCSQEQLSSTFNEFEMEMRNKEQHNLQLEILERPYTNQGERDALSSNFGVNGRSILCSLPNFDVTKMLPPDAMHNLYEGVCDVAMKAFLDYVINDLGALSCENLNYLLSGFPYPTQFSKDKPSPIEKHHISGDGQLRQSAGQTGVLIVVLPIILADFLEPDDERLLNFILLAQISQLLLAFKVKTEFISELQRMIFEHHNQFKALYPHVTLTPKCHFLTHAPSVIQMYGATRNAWCMRFESRHAWFVRVAARANNFKNISKTLASRFQMRRALDLGLGDPDASVLNEHILLVEDCNLFSRFAVPLGTEVAHILSLSENEYLQSINEIFIENVQLKQGVVLLIKDRQVNLPDFGSVTALFVKGSICCLVIRKFVTVKYDYKKNCYVCQETSKFCCLLANMLPSTQTFPMFKYKNEILVNLLHYCRTEFIG